MSAFAPIVLTSATFAPSAIDSQGVAKLFAPGEGGFDTRQSLSLSVRLPKAGGSVARVVAKATIPLTDLNTGKKVGEAIFTGEFVLPAMATQEIREALLANATEFLAAAAVTDAVTNLESIY